MSWRRDLSSIAKALTGKPSSGWRADAAAIAVYYGLSKRDWRYVVRAVRSAAASGFNGNSGWSAEIRALAAARGISGIPPGDWRKALRLLSDNTASGTGSLWDDNDTWDDSGTWDD